MACDRVNCMKYSLGINITFVNRLVWIFDIYLQIWFLAGMKISYLHL